MKSARPLIKASEKGVWFQRKKYFSFFFPFMGSSFVSSDSSACLGISQSFCCSYINKTSRNLSVSSNPAGLFPYQCLRFFSSSKNSSPSFAPTQRQGRNTLGHREYHVSCMPEALWTRLFSRAKTWIFGWIWVCFFFLITRDPLKLAWVSAKCQESELVGAHGGSGASLVWS